MNEESVLQAFSNIPMSWLNSERPFVNPTFNKFGGINDKKSNRSSYEGSVASSQHLTIAYKSPDGIP